MSTLSSQLPTTLNDAERDHSIKTHDLHSTHLDTKPVVDTRELNWRSGLALVGTALSYFTTVGFLNAFGVFQQYYTSTLLPSRSNFDISWIGSFCTFMLFAFAAPAGLMTDKVGPTIPLCFGIVCELIAIFMTSLCTEYWQFFLAQGFLLGIGTSFVAIPATTIPPLYFKRNRALSQGITIGGSSLGGIMWPIILNQLLNHDNVGFGWTMRIVGFVMVPCHALILLTVKRPLPHNTRCSLTKNDDVSGASHEKEIESNTLERPSRKKKDLSSLRSPTFILLTIGLAIAYLGFFAPIFFISTYAVHIGLTESLAFYLVSVVNGASLFGRIIPGFLADRYFGIFNSLICSCLVSGIVAFVWTTADSVTGLVVWTVAYGFTSGAIMSLQLACSTSLVADEATGAAVGMIMGSVSLTGLFGSPIAGELEKSGYLALSSFAGAALILGGGFVAAARFSMERRLHAKV